MDGATGFQASCIYDIDLAALLAVRTCTGRVDF
jgi:hypothetical protein